MGRLFAREVCMHVIFGWNMQASKHAMGIVNSAKRCKVLEKDSMCDEEFSRISCGLLAGMRGTPL